ncbi:MAG: Maf family protein [Clostridia bacterium]|nr:Maf family protein [Clostridia bacterium]
MIRHVLASASPRRIELFAQIQPNFDVIPANIEEKLDDSLSPEKNAEKLAMDKFDAVAAGVGDGDVVVACDTMVVCGDRILGKPKDEDDAFAMLKFLSGKTHKVITGVCMGTAAQYCVSHETTEVTFNDLTDEFIRAYIKSGSPMDKAGAYGIQDEGVVKEYKGSYTNVVGLPQELITIMATEI